LKQKECPFFKSTQGATYIQSSVSRDDVNNKRLA
jgi:hypothetical protein